MSLYGVSIFLHVVAALAVFGAMTVEWLALSDGPNPKCHDSRGGVCG